MKIEIKELRKEDDKKAIQFAISGMHFDWYLDRGPLLNLYGKYFWCLEINRATQAIGAYAGNELAGVLLADMKDEPKLYRSFGKTVFIKIFDLLQNIFSKNGVGVYEKANRKMFHEYSKENAPDGEIIFLAADPDAKIKGIGTALLAELERREKGKQIFLYTDDACTYQFYEHRGFDRAGEKDIVIDMHTKKVPLKCLLYSKKI